MLTAERWQKICADEEDEHYGGSKGVTLMLAQGSSGFRGVRVSEL